MVPDGDSAGSVMVDVIDDGLRHLRKEDLAKIAEISALLTAAGALGT